VLDHGERTRAAALLSPRERQRFVVAHGVLRILAATELNARPAELAWTVGRHGKPALAPPWNRWHTSLSHSEDQIAVAISDGRPVGIDVQHLVPGLDPVALSVRFFGPDEAAYVAAGPDPTERADRFAHLWARKEAVVKAAGGRLWPNLRIVVHGRDVAHCAEPATAYRVADVPAPAGYRAAVALTGTGLFTVDTATAPFVVPAAK
jgi:4'-phosphopantetheinyl transferase